ncbi:MAG: zinc dependent phospholipase C family protein [Spirochaetia bacterium]|jgi:hypothetical protein|nr:zinc dependent phospholipase C family protein [Spirochaetia bacterium]
MKYMSHKTLAAWIDISLLGKRSQLERKAFRFGCVEPDFNPGTFLKGSLHARAFRGHDFANSWKTIQRTATKMDTLRHSSVFTFYALGRLIHYVTDAFTYPHNVTFHGTLKEHMAYEKKLGDSLLVILFTISGEKSSIPILSCDSVPLLFSNAHELYLEIFPSATTDIRWALNVSMAIVITVLENINNSYNIPKKELQHESYSGIGLMPLFDRSELAIPRGFSHTSKARETII